jgi:hypothetical protein
LRNPSLYDIGSVRLYYPLPRSQLVAKKHLLKRYGQASYGSIHQQLLVENGHIGSRALLPLEAFGCNQVNGLPSFQGVVIRMQLHHCYCHIHWVQPRGFHYDKLECYRQRVLQIGVLQDI